MNKTVFTNLIISLALFMFVVAAFAPAALATPNLKNAFDTSQTGILGKAADKAGYETSDPQNQAQRVVAQIIYAALSIVGVVFIILMVYGGYLWMTDRGNEDSVRTAKKLITAAMFGLFIILAAYAITYFVLAQIAEPFLQDAPAETP
jgi:hypothetical protein